MSGLWSLPSTSRLKADLPQPAGKALQELFSNPTTLTPCLDHLSAERWSLRTQILGKGGGRGVQDGEHM